MVCDVKSLYMMVRSGAVLFLAVAVSCATAKVGQDAAVAGQAGGVGNLCKVDGDTVCLAEGTTEYEIRLTEQDFEEVAAEMDVEVAAIKAVVEVEAGRDHRGFWSGNKPVINFDLAVFRKMAARNGINLSRYTGSHPVVFSRPNARKYGSQQAAQQARLDAAMEIHPLSAIQGTFWGMFQIGGFNWKKCGAGTPEEFVTLMSRSERDQLELFAEFLRQTGLDKYLRNKNWKAFAKGYNGANYAARGYHKRLADAYHRSKKRPNDIIRKVI